MKKVLIADDDDNIRKIIRHYLQNQNMVPIEAEDGRLAIQLAIEKKPNLIILDLMMPEKDGFDVCREIRKFSEVPIIFLTAKDEEFDRVLGLELGADDFMVKPFSPRELVARIKAIFRRMESRRMESQSGSIINGKSFTYDYGVVQIDVDRREVLIKGNHVTLRPKEFDLLVHLAKNPGNVHTREVLLEQVWGYDFIGDVRTVDAHIKKIRLKLKKLGCNVLQTVWGVGYKFEL